MLSGNWQRRYLIDFNTEANIVLPGTFFQRADSFSGPNPKLLLDCFGAAKEHMGIQCFCHS
jgi:hypothetical protein